MTTRRNGTPRSRKLKAVSQRASFPVRSSVSNRPPGKEAQYQPEYTIASDFLVSAVGQLNVPKWPEITGVDEFSGKTMHSARWDWSYDVTDKKVAMLGNGNSDLSTSCGSLLIAFQAAPPLRL